jgi:cytochrome bd ubiquinol oxidase subunit II
MANLGAVSAIQGFSDTSVFVFPLLAVSGIAGVAFELQRRNERKAFFASCAYLTGMLTSVVFGVYPMVLPARNSAYSLTVATAKAGDYGLKIGLVWWILGMILAAGYSTYVYRSFVGKVMIEKDSRGKLMANTVQIGVVKTSPQSH